MKLKATIELTQEYGHSGNRPSEDYAMKKLYDALSKAFEKERIGWSLVGIKVE
jgi:hypothetical protein